MLSEQTYVPDRECDIHFHVDHTMGKIPCVDRGAISNIDHGTSNHSSRTKAVIGDDTAGITSVDFKQYSRI